MRYLVKLGEWEQKIEYFEKQLSIIDENISYLKNIKSNIIWEGKAAQSFSNYYDSYINKLINMEDKIYSTINYLNKFYENYGDSYIRIRKQFNNLSDEVI